MAAFTIGNKLKVNTPSANVDELYGPYDGINANHTLALTSALSTAFTAVSAFKEKGRTVGITVNGGDIVEYWFKTKADVVGDLVIKSATIDSTITESSAKPTDRPVNIQKK